MGGVGAVFDGEAGVFVGVVETEAVAVEPCAVVVEFGVVAKAFQPFGNQRRCLAELFEHKVAACQGGVVFRRRVGFDEFGQIAYGLTVME